MEQYNEKMDQAERTKEIEGLPEVQSMFDEIDRVKNNLPPREGSEEENETEESQIPENSETEEETDDSQQGFDEDEEEDELNEDGTVLKTADKGKKSSKFRKLYNDRYKARVEKEEALRRVAELEAMLEESLSTGTYHYGKNVYSALEKAKQNYQNAFDQGDVNAHIEAHIELTRATNAVNELEKWAQESEIKKNSHYNQRQNYSEQNYNAPEVQQDLVNDWLDTHPYLKVNSRNFDPALYGNVTSFISKLENNLQKNDAIDVIGSEEYFDTIDDYIKSVKAPKRDSSKNREYLANASGVRKISSASNSKSTSPDNITLNSDEKELAERLGCSNQEYLKFKIYRMQNPENTDRRYNKYGK
jgi:hypothetical protein